jgi:hypothetical protein
MLVFNGDRELSETTSSTGAYRLQSALVSVAGKVLVPVAIAGILALFHLSNEVIRLRSELDALQAQVLRLSSTERYYHGERQ